MGDLALTRGESFRGATELELALRPRLPPAQTYFAPRIKGE